ncbi:MAG: hypothetical protein J6J91_06075 [Alistipes sp.]|nr:hypothetical protein [Alistipes sp.]
MAVVKSLRRQAKRRLANEKRQANKVASETAAGKKEEDKRIKRQAKKKIIDNNK